MKRERAVVMSVLVLAMWAALLCGAERLTRQELESKLTYKLARVAAVEHRADMEEAARAYYQAMAKGKARYLQSLEVVRKQVMAKDMMDEAGRITAIQEQVRQELKAIDEQQADIGLGPIRDYMYGSRVRNEPAIEWLMAHRWEDEQTKLVYEFRKGGMVCAYDQSGKRQPCPAHWSHSGGWDFGYAPDGKERPLLMEMSKNMKSLEIQDIKRKLKCRE